MISLILINPSLAKINFGAYSCEVKDIPALKRKFPKVNDAFSDCFVFSAGTVDSKGQITEVKKIFMTGDQYSNFTSSLRRVANNLSSDDEA